MMTNQQVVRNILRSIGLLSLAVAAAWMYFEPSFEPLQAVLGGIAAIITSFFIKDPSDSNPTAEIMSSASPESGDQEDAFHSIPSTEEAQQHFEHLLAQAAIIDHDRLFGVDDELHSLKQLLANPEGDWVISLFGEGGIGKTALAYEAVRLYAASAGFTRLAWVSAKQKYFLQYAGPEAEQQPELQWADLVKQIAGQLNIDLGFSRNMWIEDFRRAIKQLPRGEKCLIVVDNLETIEELSVVQYFKGSANPRDRLVKPHKLLVTTRKSTLQQASDVAEITVTGLSPRSTYQFIRDLGKFNDAIMAASDEQLEPILKITEGNPFLIKLVVRRFLHTRKDIGSVLQDLHDKSTTDIAARLRDYLYMQSLIELDAAAGPDAAKQIMNAFCPLQAGDLLTYEQLHIYSGITSPADFEKVRQLACDLSLIRVSGSTAVQKYSIHSLLWEFTCGNG